MGKRTEYKAGLFNWVELNAPDVIEASDFYSSVLPASANVMPTEYGDYGVIEVGGESAAGIFASENMLPTWLAYVAVEDADMTAKKAVELGGSVLSEPSDVSGMNRWALLADPNGAAFAIWQAKGSPGATRVNDVGCFCMTQLNTSNPAKAQEFYSELFNWEFRVQSPEPNAYWGIFVDDWLNAGMMPGAPDSWLVYFTSSNLESSKQRVIAGGGSITVQPTEIPNGGRFMVAQDPSGAYFALFEGRTDD